MYMQVNYILRKGQVVQILSEGYDFYRVRHRGGTVCIFKRFIGNFLPREERDEDSES